MMQSKMRRCAFVAAALLAGTGAWAADQYFPGVVKFSRWNNLPGTAVSDLTSSPRYPHSPDQVTFPVIPDSGADIGDNYGGRIEFLWTAPSTGRFQFAISADDQAELWISTDQTPANLVRVATEPEWNGHRAFGTDARRPACAGSPGTGTCENVSAPISFTGGQRYLVVGLWKEGGGGDSLAITAGPEGTVFTDGMDPIPTEQIGVNASNQLGFLGSPLSSASFVHVGRTVTLNISLYVPPGVAVPQVQWLRNGVAIPGATSLPYTYNAMPADANQDLVFTVRLPNGTVSEGVLIKGLPDEADVLSPGFLFAEFFTGIPGVNVADLENAPDFVNNQPSATLYIPGFSTPDGWGDNYGVRVTGFIIPQESGDYDFFLRSDDASRLSLSTDSTAANLQVIAEEFGCCGAFMEPGDPRTTASPIPLVAGRQYRIEALMKEGGGGDYLQVAWRKVGDPTPAAQLRPIIGPVLATIAESGGVTLQFTQQPQSQTIVEGRSGTLRAAATAFPWDAVLYQWKKNGVNIAGANGPTYTLPVQQVSDSGARYSVVATTVANRSVTSSEATITVVPDTFPPQVVSAGSVRKGGNVEIGIFFDEAVNPASAANPANYTLSAGTVTAARHVKPKGTQLADYGGVVLVASGLTAGQTITVSVRNVADIKGNAISPASPATAQVKITGTFNWVGIGADEINLEKGNTDYSDDVVARGPSKNYVDAYDFDLISGGSANWDAYDEATFVYEEITGDFDRVVRVEYQDPTSQWARAGLHVREALDEGTLREDAVGGPGVANKPMSRNFSLRVNPAVRADGGTGNNGLESIDRNVTGGNYRGTPSGVPGLAPTPSLWLRLAREGNVLRAWRSVDNGATWQGGLGSGLNWENPDTGEPPLAQKLYVGIYYAPEYNNNGTKDVLAGSAIAQFRDYGPWPATPLSNDLGTLNITRSGSNITITWTAAGARLQSTTALPGGWMDVAGAPGSPYTTAIGATPMYFRLTR